MADMRYGGEDDKGDFACVEKWKRNLGGAETGKETLGSIWSGQVRKWLGLPQCWFFYYLFFKCEAYINVKLKVRWEQRFSDATAVQGRGEPEGGDQHQ